jgi:hypothetical protein
MARFQGSVSSRASRASQPISAAPASSGLASIAESAARAQKEFIDAQIVDGMDTDKALLAEKT